MKKMYVVGLLSLLVMAVGCTKFAAMKGPFDGDSINHAFVEYMVDKADDKLDLTEPQQAQLTGTVETMMECALALRPATNELKQQIADELRKEHLDQKQLDELLLTRMQQYRTIVDSGREGLAEFHGSLSAQQREALAQLVLAHGNGGWHGSK